MPHLAPASMAMLHIDRRLSMDRSQLFPGVQGTVQGTVNTYFPD